MTHPLHITDPKAAFEFALGGAARFTLVSQKTGDRKTFRVKKAEDAAMYFVQLLTGPDNTEDYTYLGFLKDGGNGLIAGKKGNANHPAFKAFDWTFRHIEQGHMPEKLEFWHEGRCARCARVLTDPVSIERGLGPECANH